jgi:hypothetical protein
MHFAKHSWRQYSEWGVGTQELSTQHRNNTQPQSNTQHTHSHEKSYKRKANDAQQNSRIEPNKPRHKHIAYRTFSPEAMPNISTAWAARPKQC